MSERITLAKIKYIRGVKFTVTTHLDTMTSLCTIVECVHKGFQIDSRYEGRESLRLHLEKVHREMHAVAEVFTGWKDTIKELESWDFRVVNK